MRRLAVCLLAVLSVALAMTGAPQAATRHPSVTIAFAGNGGTEKDSVKVVTKDGTCTTQIDSSFDARDLAWHTKWSHVRLPSAAKSVTKKVPVHVTGASVLDIALTQQGVCSDPHGDDTHCTMPVNVVTDGVLRLRRRARGYSATIDVGALEVAGPPVQSQSDSRPDCVAPIRTTAFHAAVRLPHRSSSAVVRRVDAGANANGVEENRPHMEVHEHTDDVSIDLVSDVGWGGVVTTRFNKR